MLRTAKLLSLVILLAAGVWACGDANDPCNNVTCDQGFSCLIESGTPTCVANGTGGGSGTGKAGDACQTTTDCASPLTCKPDLNGDTVCSQ